MISEKLADELDADILLILTSVDCVSVNYETTQEKALHEVTSAELKEYMEEGQFEDYTMLPKIRAAIDFVEAKPGRKAIITSIAKAKDGYLGKTGTIVTA